MTPEKNGPPKAQANAGGRQQQKADNLTIHPQTEKSNPIKQSTIAGFIIEKMAAYVAGGMNPETAARFTRGELAAIYKGKHRSRDMSGAWRVTPPPEALSLDAAMAKCEEGLTEILKCCAEGVSETYTPAPEEPPKPPEPPPKYEGTAALAEYARRGIPLMPCVPVQDDPKRYRPIVGKDKWGSTATADMERIMKYQSGALWPNEPIHLFRFIPKDASLLCWDIDKGHADGADGEANLYRLLRAKGYDPLPTLLRDLSNFPVRVETPSGGLHLYFSHNGQFIKKAKLAEGVEVFHTDPLTAGGSRKQNGEYVLYGCLDAAPPLPAELLEIITTGGQPYTAPEKPARQSENSVRGDADKDALKGRLRQYIAARGITVTKKGGLEWMRCPLHDDDSPSMQINTSGKYTGILKCHACGASLDVFGLARITAGLPEGKKHFPQVVQEVKNALGMGSEYLTSG